MIKAKSGYIGKFTDCGLLLIMLDKEDHMVLGRCEVETILGEKIPTFRGQPVIEYQQPDLHHIHRESFRLLKDPTLRVIQVSEL